MPTVAEQISQQDADQVAKSVNEPFNEALHAKDAARIAALYTENAVRVAPEGPQFGRAEVEKTWMRGFKVYDPGFVKVERVAVIGHDVVSSLTVVPAHITARTDRFPKGLRYRDRSA